MTDETKSRGKQQPYFGLCVEFGREKTNIARREFVIKHKRLPSYIELLAVLALRAGPK